MFFYSRLLDLYFLQLYSLLYKAPPEEQEGQSEEEQLKQKTKERARKEFLGAVASEGKNNCQMWLGISIHCARIFANSSRKLECSRRSRAVKYFYDVLKTLSTLLCMNAKKLVIQRKCAPFIGVYARLCRVPCFVILKRFSSLYFASLFSHIFIGRWWIKSSS